MIDPGLGGDKYALSEILGTLLTNVTNSGKHVVSLLR